jgi:hypothetical protein
VNNQNSVEIVTKDFDNDVRFILGEVDFLKDIGWVEQDLVTEVYQTTERGKMNAEASKMVFWI